ncbi:accessory Sec system protein Asp2 [Streptococcus pseudoporcinus]|uniref:Accessory secretory protein Asp2 n=1 Tax=Streptococcus pseudoporcinus TaxID=361101 RepID=A0A4U9XIN9_9STRE|nr:accessory Sec system protein Asp2 [Streptococcus pseudoporcinus]VTS12645.1 accessory secretory protein Asp2 [Streptococcus pseudoporcinus]VUC65291.1 accessory secretory protein Asp2 [Streptococcus pseudoporcinus]VUC96120.1 accessory secretory protein Asp2 [Streptococcus pseudoporcinus]VUC96516.1 accessory secretory protein Asp2 [Streptococcus pseudoporcinus]
MTKEKMRVLQIGHHNWSDLFTIPEAIDWSYGLPTDYQLSLIDQKGKPVAPFSLILFTDPVNYQQSYEDLLDFAIPYSVFYNNQITDTKPQVHLFRSKLAEAMDMTAPEELVKQLSQNFFPGQEGSKADMRYSDVSQNFSGQVSYEGNAFTVFEGDFGQEFQSLLTWRYNSLQFSGQSLNFWLEYVKEGDLTLNLKVYSLAESTSNIVEVNSFSESDLMEQVTLGARANNHYLSFVLHVKGRGKLKIGSLHQRRSRERFGQFIAGGQRLVDDHRQELIAYFSPGDLKPPLNVYFSGYRPAEGFEGYWMMSQLKAPFILIGDPRLEGGSFYLASDQLEKQVTDFITEKLDHLGFNPQEMIMSGLSMGTLGAAYYASQLQPHAVILGKPLFSLGNVAYNGYQIRPDDFGTAFDILHFLTGALNQETIERLNLRFWQAIDQADLSKTLFAIAYMKDDDYDPTAYIDFLNRVQGKNVKVISKGIEGRHNDNSVSINQWFLNQYARIMTLDFGRNP